MPKHIHADLMVQYAKDAMETDKPWERWEYFDGNLWVVPDFPMAFDEECQYRRKPNVVKINGFEVPAPCAQKPSYGAEYYIPHLSSEDFCDNYV